MAAPYITKAEVLALAQKIKPTLTVADIPDLFMDASGELIETRTKVWEVTTNDQYVNGEGTDWIFCPTVPINSISAITIIAADETETTLTLTGTDRQVAYDPKTGKIQKVHGSYNVALNQSSCPLFPCGTRNIKISGNFGKDPYKILGLLQAMLVFQMMERVDADFKKVDIMSEKIGDYSYQLSPMEYTKDPTNQKKTLEGYIEWLFSKLPKDEYLDMVLAI